MKTAAIIRIVTGVVVAVLLIGFLTAYFSGYNIFSSIPVFTNDTDSGDWVMVSPTPTQETASESSETDGKAMASPTLIPATQSSTGTTAETMDGSVQVAIDGIKDIDISWVAGNVRVEVGSGDVITFYETSKKDLTDTQRMRYRVKDGKLSVTYCEKTDTVWDWLDIDRLNMPAKDLVLLIPQSMLEQGTLRELEIDAVSANVQVGAVSANAQTGSMKLQKLDVETVSGTAECRAITADKVSLQSTSGDLTAQDMITQELDIETVSGRANVTGQFDRIDTESVSGSVEIIVTGDTVPTKIETESVSGSIRISLPDNSGFTAKLDTVSGSFRCDFATTMQNNRYTYGDGSRSYSFGSVSGSVTIKKA